MTTRRTRGPSFFSVLNQVGPFLGFYLRAEDPIVVGDSRSEFGLMLADEISWENVP